MIEEASLLSLPEGMRVEHIQITKQGLVIEIEASHPTSCCQLCAQPSDSIKTHYRRVLRDAPCAGRQVQLVLTVRKFYCRNPYCPQKVFTERLPTFVEPWARMTIRCCQHITSIGLATCGKGGARLAARLGIATTRPTILRRIMRLPDPFTQSVIYLGIDDFAFRRGYRFGTILVNLESHRVVDLLPDRLAETAARWMYQQPDLAVVSRDRGGEYASAAREGAPQAIQCADRFHVVKNLTEAVQVLLARCQAEILAEKQQDEPGQNEQDKPIISIEAWRPPEPAHVEKVRLARRAGRYARYEHVVELDRQGMATKEIAGRVGLSDRTVRDWLKQETFPEAQKRRKKQSSFDPFAAYVLKRGPDGEHNGLVLWREIQSQGYTGTDRSVYRSLKTLKQAEVRASVNPERLQKYSANAAIWLFMRDPKKLEELEHEDLAAFCQTCAPLKKAYDLLQDFLSIVHKREGHRLDAWLTRVAESGLPELQSFASGVEKDKDAVQAGLTWPTNNGMVEGHVTKLKLLKRTMYGRAGFARLAPTGPSRRLVCSGILALSCSGGLLCAYHSQCSCRSGAPARADPQSVLQRERDWRHREENRMEQHERRLHGSSFGAAAAAYAEHRPDYAQAAVRWALEPAPGPRVLDLGAGTGKLTAALVALGAEVIAVEPDPAMLAELRRALSAVRALLGSAEAIPLPDASVDAVLAGNALHWFDMGVAGPEIARVLVPGGILAGLWNVIDNRVDWVAGLERVSGSAAIGPRDTLGSWRAETADAHLPTSGLVAQFGSPEQAEFPHGQRRTADSLVATLATRAGLLVMPEQEQEATLGRIRAFLASRPETARGEFTLPMLTGVLRVRRL